MSDNDFFSLDRLVEFGLGLGMARQMINVMNESIKTMHIPGVDNSMQPVLSKVYYVAIDNAPVGPLNDGEMMHLIAQKKIDKNTLVWMPGMCGWKTIESVPEVLKIVALAPPPVPKTL
ncbi:MAG: DUF4339 domain-containing protein [Bacteroidales bacterium]|nr:DUF4339 domain-containing protein [Bacteroidales bacterium]MBQ7818084.1 DUF4339 domain-containing protein [Bacteroidales bacterium]